MNVLPLALDLSLTSWCLSAAWGATTLKEIDGRWTLLRDGQPYHVNGVGGPWRLQDLKDRGGNSVRNWSVGDGTAAMLDDASSKGITVTLCIDLPRPRGATDWSNPPFVEEQLARVRAAVEAYRKHPALLFWSLGNEAESGQDAYWQFLERAAQLIKAIDSDHPVMTIVAEVGDAKAGRLMRECPSVDLVGINSYAGLPSLPARLTKQGFTKPYVVTEFGPRGQWEVRKTDFGAPIEQTSTEKSAFIAQSLEQVINVDPRCVGAYLFLWAQKQESTHTWFGLFTEEGKPTEQIDVAERFWTGKWPADLGPRVLRLESDLNERRVKPGTAGIASVHAMDPEGKPLKFRWHIRSDRGSENLGGAREDIERTSLEVVQDADKQRCRVTAPSAPGRYRLFVEVEDAGGKCATANMPFFVE